MANNCYNIYSFYGNKKVIEQVKKWKEELNSIPSTDEDPYCKVAVFRVFYPNIENIESVELGSKWVHQDDNSISPSDEQIGFLSAWGPPNSLLKNMACLLFKLDKTVVIENNFNIDNGTIGVSYVSPYDEENCYIQEAHFEFERNEVEDLDTAYEIIQGKLMEAQIEILDYLMDDMPGTAKKIKKFNPHLKSKFNWHDYS